MERKIKFRGKRIGNGEWVVGDLLHIAGGCLIYFGSDTDTTEPDIEKSNPIAVEFFKDEIAVVAPDTIGQFTGITDEHGNEVFEGDILEADYKYDLLGYNGGVDPDNDCICYGVVEFDNDALQWVLNIHKAEYPISKQIEEDGCSLFPLQIFGHEYGYDNCDLKIIGNRFDNPSLISDKQ